MKERSDRDGPKENTNGWLKKILKFSDETKSHKIIVKKKSKCFRVFFITINI